MAIPGRLPRRFAALPSRAWMVRQQAFGVILATAVHAEAYSILSNRWVDAADVRLALRTA
jgi:hypothetical protein